MCLDYDPEWNMVVTGSRDCDVKMWNPYVVNKPSVVLKGHTFAVVQVVARGSENQVIRYAGYQVCCNECVGLCC